MLLNSVDTNLDPGGGEVPPIKEFRVIVSTPDRENAEAELDSISNPITFTIEFTFKNPCRVEVSFKNEFAVIEISELYELTPKTFWRPELTLDSY